MTSRRTLLLAALAYAPLAAAGAPDPFAPLTSPATVGSALAQPFKLPPGFTATLVVDADTLEANTGGAFPDNLRNWDMIEVYPQNPNFVFITNETDNGGVLRYDRSTGQATLLMNANPARFDDPQVANPGAFNPLDDTFVDLDGIRFTPAGTLITGEEEPTGRLFEIVNPNTATGLADANVRWLDKVPAVRHEGMDFDAQGNLFFVDENNSGSIYKYTPADPTNLAAGGQTSVLVVDGFTGDPSANFNDAAAGDRLGSARWVPITDTLGNALTTANPFDFVVSGAPGGELAADEVNAAPFGRPEDLHLVTLDNGNQALVVALTSEDRVISIELGDGSDDAFVRDFVNSAVTPDAVSGLPVGIGGDADAVFGLTDPDNLAIGPNGEVFIIEDNTPGDIFVATDADNDGIAETVALWASLGEAGSEPTGLFLDPADPTGRTFLVNIQHPSTGNDALYAITVPEPASLALLGVGGIAALGRRRSA